MTAHPLLSKEIYEYALQYRDDEKAKVVCRDQDMYYNYPLSFGSLQIKENRFLTAYMEVPGNPFYRPTAKVLCEYFESTFERDPSSQDIPFVAYINRSTEDQPAYPVVRLEKEYEFLTLKYYNVQVQHYKIFKD